MTVDLELALHIALRSVLIAAEKQGLELSELVGHAVLLVEKYPLRKPEYEEYKAVVRAEIEKAYGDILRNKSEGIDR